MEQNTKEWLQARLGNFTGSRISELVGTPRKKDAEFTDTALSYIYEVAGERKINTSYLEDDELWDIYQTLMYSGNKITQWGHEQEDLAARCYARKTGAELQETGSVRHATIEHFAASPDRLTDDLVIEIKSPMPKNFMKYRYEIKDAATLKATAPGYYWQMQAEMMCCKKEAGDFVVFCPFVEGALHVARIARVEEDCKVIEEKINKANEFINKNLL